MCKGRDTTCILLFTETGSPFEKILFSCTNICIPFVGTLQGILFSHVSRVPSFTKCSFEKILFSWYPFARCSFLRKKGILSRIPFAVYRKQGVSLCYFCPNFGIPQILSFEVFFRIPFYAQEKIKYIGCSNFGRPQICNFEVFLRIPFYAQEKIKYIGCPNKRIPKFGTLKKSRVPSKGYLRARKDKIYWVSQQKDTPCKDKIYWVSQQKDTPFVGTKIFIYLFIYLFTYFFKRFFYKG